MKDLIKKALEDKGMSQKELAEKIYVTPQAVSKWIKGESQPTFDNIKLMVEIFGSEFGDKAIKKGMQNRKIMKKQHSELKDLDTIEKANAEAELLLEESGARNYSHATYVLLKWFVPAVIGLTYHQFINNHDKDAEYDYDTIFCNMNDFFEECYRYKNQYPNELEYEFFLMGGDLFESFEPNKLVNHDYAHDAEDSWYRFKKAFDKMESSLSDEFKVALVELISENSCY